MDIILASQSPRRRELLERMGLSFTVHATDIDEHMDRKLAPGPLVARHTPTLPVALAYPSAAWAAPCSWDVSICLISSLCL